MRDSMLLEGYLVRLGGIRRARKSAPIFLNRGLRHLALRDLGASARDVARLRRKLRTETLFRSLQAIGERRSVQSAALIGPRISCSAGIGILT